MAKLSDQINKVKKSLASAPAEDETEAPKEVKKVAKKVVKKVEKEEPEVKAKGKKVNGKEAKGNGKAKSPEKAPRNQEVPEGHVSVAMLASEAQITAQSARVKLRASEMERPEGRWVFAEGSKLLKKAREVLGIEA